MTDKVDPRAMPFLDELADILAEDYLKELEPDESVDMSTICQTVKPDSIIK